MDGSQNRSGHFEEEINLLSLLGIERLGKKVNHARNQKLQGPRRYNSEDNAGTPNPTKTDVSFCHSGACRHKRSVHIIVTGGTTRVEAGSNTSTVTLRVVRGDEMGLKKGRAIA
jgi:hypothetical protein